MIQPPWPVSARDSRKAMVAPTEQVQLVLGPGGRIGKYELHGQLGMGTFGLVFAARDTELDRPVALKVLNPTHVTNRDLVQRFLQEARTSARIQHPGIVTVFDSGRVPSSTGETAFIVMELLQGESLTSRLNPLRPARASRSRASSRARWRPRSTRRTAPTCSTAISSPTTSTWCRIRPCRRASA